MLIPLLLLLLPVQAQITVYNNTLPNPTALVPAASMDFAAQIRLVPPAPPQPPFTLLDLVIPADPNAAGYPLSIPQRGNFLGFSIELSVATNLLGDAPGNMRPNFLNYMANIQRRAGRGPLVRVGGNTQDSSTLFVKGLPDGASVNKIKGQSVANAGDSKTIQVTPIINYSLDLLYTMSNITALVGAEWYFGLAFNESDPSPNIALVAEWSSRILGDSLKGLALGNEPDLYAVHGDRDESYNLGDYLDEFERARDTVVKKNSLPEKQILLGPAVCCAMPGFGIQDVLASPWLQDNIDYLKAVTVQRYPNNNCQLDGVVRDPQALFPDYLNHTSAQVLTLPYLEASATAQAAGKEMLMMEMNTASCGGFPGISDSFGAAMWIADWAFQLAWGNFSASLMHVGGQGVYYNPFTPPPWTKAYAQWTTGSIYYSSLVVAEAFGSSGNAQIIDLLPTPQDVLHPTYVVYENGVAVRVVLFNYVSDPSGASTYTANVPSSSASVYVRYLRADSVAEQWDITWGGQTMNGSSASDGRMYGQIETQVVACVAGRCAVTVPAPSIALVFLTEDALKASLPKANIQAEYATTVLGKGKATIPIGALQTGNGWMPPGMMGTSGRSGGDVLVASTALLALSLAITAYI